MAMIWIRLEGSTRFNHVMCCVGERGFESNLLHLLPSCIFDRLSCLTGFDAGDASLLLKGASAGFAVCDVVMARLCGFRRPLHVEAVCMSGLPLSFLLV